MTKAASGMEYNGRFGDGALRTCIGGIVCGWFFVDLCYVVGYVRIVFGADGYAALFA